MITRREIVLGGALTILFASGCCSCAQELEPHGCLLSDEQARQLLRASSGAQLFRTGEEPVIRSSGNRELDFALAQTLAMLADTFKVLPGFAYYDDYDGKNARATSQRILSKSDGTVLFGKRMLRSLLARPEHPEAAVAMVCAHECGHIVQYQKGLMRTLQGWDWTFRRVELHADFIAGYFAGIRKGKRPSFPAVAFATTAFGIGDYDESDPDHHGTPDERAKAVVMGFRTAFLEQRTLADAIEIGVKYAKAL